MVKSIVDTEIEIVEKPSLIKLNSPTETIGLPPLIKYCIFWHSVVDIYKP
jgi:hypothetical protein